jgi:DNA repair photolyase
MAGMGGAGRASCRAVSNPPNPWAGAEVQWLGAPPEVEPRVEEEQAKSLLTRNQSPDVPFDWGVNAYRGCAHACAYCYARPTHEYLGYGAGTDFDSRLVVKVNAPELLRAELGKRSWKREVVCVSGNTDPYQPLEASYGLTRRLLQEFAAARTPVVVITKGALIRRDVDVLQQLHRDAGVTVHVSLGFWDPEWARAMDPGAPAPHVRLETIRILAEAGLDVGLSLSPVIPGLNDEAVPGLLERAAAAGARRVFATLLRLPGSVRGVFFERLERHSPERARRVERALRETRGGELNDGRFGQRMRGQGPRWAMVQQMLEVHCRRLGLELGERTRPELPPPAARPTQNELFP